tara:strand:+ start:1155 stop:1910 length:756 start_codon:yes stop_codon:yes gene_type:complete
MQNKDENKKKAFLNEGYFVYQDLFDLEFIKNILKNIDDAKDTLKYFDNKNHLRRIEKLYDKGVFLNELNFKILTILETIFEQKFVIFKDKFNAKPPGGEGFFAHFDGIFNFIDENNIKKDGWYEYGDFFINVLIALDECNEKNGTIELSKIHEGSFNDLLRKTKNNGTPELNKKTLETLSFKSIDLKVGDVVVFSNKCPHKSKINNSNKNRRVLYYTYTPFINGSKYNQYFTDKEKSKNPLKALEEKKSSF